MKPIGKYELIAEIGAGGMGTIYRAKDQVLDREVALKVLRTEADLDSELKERFYREARACARLTHPNIITVYDLGEAGGSVYIAMELLTGCDLRRMMRENRPMSLDAKIELMAQVCEALDHAHRQQLVHRDIKPSNIFVCDDHRVKVLDFGIARMPTSNLTMAGKVLGSPNYMAPEQIRGGKCDSRSDLFSAAIVFCEFLVHAHPFQDEFIPRRIVASPPDSLRKRDPQVPEALEALLFRVLDKDPARRVQSGGELAAGLRAILETLPDSTPAPAPAPAMIPAAPTRARETPAAQSGPPVSANGDGEQRLAEFLRIVSAFDEALDRRDYAAARSALDLMRALAAADGRFTLAVSDCDARLNGITLSSAVRAVAAAVPAPEPAAAIAPAVSAPAPYVSRTPPLPNLSPPVRQSPPAPPPAASRKTNPVTLAAMVAGVLVLLLISYWLRNRVDTPSGAGKFEPSAATATIGPAGSALLSAADPSSKQLSVLKPGQAVNVIVIPSTADRAFSKVQPVAGGRPGPVGFVRTADLTNWSGATPESGFSIVELFAPPESAGEPEWSAQIQRWKDYVARFPASPRISAAHLETARLELALAHAARKAGRPASDWQPHLDAARKELAGVTVPGLASEAALLRAQLSDSQAPPAAQNPRSGEPPASAPSPADRILRTRVNALWEDGNYRQAMQLVDQILADSPNHQEAQRWKRKIRASQEAEARAQ
ncbi:MAG TPA: protein kinase [Bryobacteraceae bacterium]|nr:protein kinase [Bryobacteraceae bacterium]